MTLAKLLNRTLLISKIIFSNTVYSSETKNVGYLKPCMPNLKKMDYKTLQEKRIKVGMPNPISVYYSVCPSLIKNNRVIIALFIKLNMIFYQETVRSYNLLFSI